MMLSLRDAILPTLMPLHAQGKSSVIMTVTAVIIASSMTLNIVIERRKMMTIVRAVIDTSKDGMWQWYWWW